MAGVDHMEPLEGAGGLSGAERPGDQPLHRLRSQRRRDDPGRGDEDQLAARRGAQVDARGPRRADARPEGGTAVRLRAHPQLLRERLRPRRRAGPGDLRRRARRVLERQRAERAGARSRVRRARLLPPAARAAARARRGRDRRRDRPRARPALPARRTDGSSRSPTSRRSSRGGTIRAAGRRRASSGTSTSSRATTSAPSPRTSTVTCAAGSRSTSSSSGRRRRARRSPTCSRPRRQSCVVGSTAGEGYATPTELLELARAVPRAGAARRGDGGARALAGGSRPERPCRIGLGRRRSRPRPTAASSCCCSRRASSGSRTSAPRAVARRRRTARARSTRRGWSRATDGVDLAVHRTLAHGGVGARARARAARARPRRRHRRAACATELLTPRRRPSASASSIVCGCCVDLSTGASSTICLSVPMPCSGNFRAETSTRRSSEPTVWLYACTAPSRRLPTRGEVVDHRREPLVELAAELADRRARSRRPSPRASRRRSPAAA